jgi:hypothetical protein
MEELRQPSYFVSAGLHATEGDIESSATGSEADEGLAWSIDVGYVTWNADLGLAFEAGVLASGYEIEVTPGTEDDVDVTRYLLGLRLIDASPESAFLWHLRGGFAHRQDEGSIVDDDGSGWYAGGGVEWKLGGFSVGPGLLYTDTSSIDAREWVLGVNASYRF